MNKIIKKNRIFIFTTFMHPLVINEYSELQKHLDLVILSGFLETKVLIREFFRNIFTMVCNIKYVLLFSKIIFNNLGNFPINSLIYWYLHLLHILVLDKKYKFDIIHAHWIYPAGMIATTYGKYFHQKVVITAHGYDADERTFTNLNLKKVVIETGENADFILTGEQRLYDNLSTCGFKNVIFTPPFVKVQKDYDVSDFRKEKKIDLNCYTVTFGPHLKKSYGAIDFANAIINVAPHIENLFVICLGEGEESGFVKELFDRNKINFEITGKLSNSELLNYLKISDTICNLGYIGQGIFTLEAFSCGKPVIGWNDVAEIKIMDGVTGLLTKSGNVEGLSELILKLYTDPDLRKKMGNNARKIVETEYSMNKRITQILSTYV